MKGRRESLSPPQPHSPGVSMRRSVPASLWKWNACAQTATCGDATQSDLPKVTLQVFCRQLRGFNENVFSGGHWFFLFKIYFY